MTIPDKVYIATTMGGTVDYPKPFKHTDTQ